MKVLGRLASLLGVTVTHDTVLDEISVRGVPVELRLPMKGRRKPIFFELISSFVSRGLDSGGPRFDSSAGVLLRGPGDLALAVMVSDNPDAEAEVHVLDLSRRGSVKLAEEVLEQVWAGDETLEEAAELLRPYMVAFVPLVGKTWAPVRFSPENA